MLGCKKGATAVEFALVAPIFLLFVIGIMDLGRMMWIRNTMQFAVEQTARYAMVNTSKTESELEAYAPTVISGAFVGDIDFSPTTIDLASTPNTVTIEAAYTFSPVVGEIVGHTLVPTVTLTAKSKVPLI